MVLDPDVGTFESSQGKNPINISMDTMHVELGSTSPIQLDFAIRKTPLADRWIERVLLAQKLGYTIDEPDRFYGLADFETERSRAIVHVNHQIDIINSTHPGLIKRRLYDILDQDTLNYLHHIFEEHHGLLDQQNSAVWLASDDKTRVALARLNTAVHRCESVGRGNRARCVVTYYGLPKTEKLDIPDYDLLESHWKFGTVHLCYVEIGKTLLDLAMDNDQYIGDDAFKPFINFSADFMIQFNGSPKDWYQQQSARMWRYYDQHQEWFESRGWYRIDPRLKFGIFPLADLINDLDHGQLLDEIQSRQWVNRVWFS